MSRIVHRPAATQLTELPEGCFDSPNLEHLALPPTVTKLGASCFNGACIADLALPARQLRLVGRGAFAGLQTRSIDLSEAVDVELPDDCFKSAKLQSLTLPAGNTERKRERSS